MEKSRRSGPRRPGDRISPARPRAISGPLLQGLVGALPAVNAALRAEGKYVALVPPGELIALRRGDLNWMYDQENRQLADLVDRHGRITKKARLVPLGPEAAAAAVFQLLSVVTSQYYLHQIHDELTSIKEDLRRVEGRMVDTHLGAVLGAADIVDEMHALTMGAVAEGHDLASLPEPAEFWSRLAVAEHPLRSATHAAELAFVRLAEGLREELGQRASDGSVAKRVLRRNEERRALQKVIGWARDWGTLWWASARATADWYAVVLVRSMLTDSPILRMRLAQNGQVWERQRAFMAHAAREIGWLLGPSGTHWLDRVTDVAPGLALEVGRRIAFPWESAAADVVNSVGKRKVELFRLPELHIGAQDPEAERYSVECLYRGFATQERNASLAASGLYIEAPRAELTLVDGELTLLDRGREDADEIAADRAWLEEQRASVEKHFSGTKPVQVAGRKAMLLRLEGGDQVAADRAMEEYLALLEPDVRAAFKSVSGL
jgi:hypothetical protein